MPINVGIIGYGFSTKNYHIPFISSIPEYNITAILQRAAPPENTPSRTVTPEPNSHCTIDHPGIRHHRTPEPFFADKDIDLVVVATHIDTHAFFAEGALRAGKHVIVDKPFARTTQEADALVTLAKEKSLTLTCYQNRRWDGDFLTLTHLHKANALGKIAEAEFHYDWDHPPWLDHLDEKKFTAGYGHMFTLGAHTIDQALTLFGRPASVTAFLRCQRGMQEQNQSQSQNGNDVDVDLERESDAEDSYTIILQYSGDQENLLVTIKSCIITPMRRQLKMFVRGTEGSYVKYQTHPTCPQETQIFTGASPLSPTFGNEPPDAAGELTTYDLYDAKIQSFDEESGLLTGAYPSIRGRWMGFWENIVGVLKGEEELKVQMGTVRDGIRVIELARVSSGTGASVEWSD
ncbi:uncharacterized protein BDV14DRAFT_207200 [Aspergillus stella-maris]|uniref:uncharacterized protein n=1 Tax=Aspergillus stella-maris TaxID=1810926 RepID=UPI003CCE42A8